MGAVAAPSRAGGSSLTAVAGVSLSGMRSFGGDLAMPEASGWQLAQGLGC